MRETIPTIRLIAEPKIRWHEVVEYLEEIEGLDWYDRVMPEGYVAAWGRGIASDAELLVEYAGRRCYRSWAPGLNANVTKVREDSGVYADNLLSSKHGAVLEHAQFTFDFDNVSRVFTHELVRHRAGVAISQESLRYVRLTDLGFRIPDVLADGPMMEFRDEYGSSGPTAFRDAVVSIVERLEEFQRDAAEAFGLDDDGVPFHYKKEVTSALRRLAPLGLSTGMVWSANARTLRHVIAQRTAPGAEEEIRYVFDQVARTMIQECPLLFGDFEQYDVTDEGKLGKPYSELMNHHLLTTTPAWVPKWEKV